MSKFFANPYDISATGFYFETFEEYTEKASKARNSHGDKVEEFEIDFIDGETIDCELSEAWGINQANIEKYIDCEVSWSDHEKTIFIIAVGECSYPFDADSVDPESDFEVDIYHCSSMRDLAEELVDNGLFGDIPEHLANYIDYDAIAADLSCDYIETTIGGDRLIYSCR